MNGVIPELQSLIIEVKSLLSLWSARMEDFMIYSFPPAGAQAQYISASVCEFEPFRCCTCHRCLLQLDISTELHSFNVRVIRFKVS